MAGTHVSVTLDGTEQLESYVLDGNTHLGRVGAEDRYFLRQLLAALPVGSTTLVGVVAEVSPVTQEFTIRIDLDDGALDGG